MNITELSALALATLIHSGEISSVEVTKAFIDKIKKNDNKYNSFITVTEELALRLAGEADNRVKNGEILSSLDGVPVAVKDCICVKDIKNTCASKMLKDFVSPYNAAAVEHLLNAGVVIIGKTNLDEFSMGSTNDTSYFGAVHNPWDLTRVPGGSSGGSAAAVAARLVPLALGTDTGGSVRQPASMCGIFGMKPTYGAVSRYGLVAYAHSFDQIGVCARDTDDCAALLDIISKKDNRDSTYIGVKKSFADKLSLSVAAKKIGIPCECVGEGVDTLVKSAFLTAVDEMKKMGCEVEFFDFPILKYVIPCYYVISNAEASTNLSRFDGVKYGYRAAEFDGAEDMITKSRSQGFGKEVKKRIMLGTMAITSENYENYYNKAMKVKQTVKVAFDELFKKYDMIMCPTAPSSAGIIGVDESDTLKHYLADIFTVSANIAGLPAISVPCGFAENDMPIGFQFIGKRFDDAEVLGFASAYRSQTEWHKAIPKAVTENV